MLTGANRKALGHNPLCGDRLVLNLFVDDNGAIKDAAFQGSGCAISVASASMLTEMVKGKTAAEAQRLFDYLHAACTGADAIAAGSRRRRHRPAQGAGRREKLPDARQMRDAGLAYDAGGAQKRTQSFDRMSETLPMPQSDPPGLEEKVIERLRSVFDPEIPVNLYDLGLIYRLDFQPVAEGKFDLHIDMTLTAPACPVAGQMPGMVEQAVQTCRSFTI